jgi:ribosome-binding protein aMBF1 (putative translation factor)
LTHIRRSYEESQAIHKRVNLRHSDVSLGKNERMKKADIQQLFGRNLEEAMRRRGINQQRLGELSGLSPSHISEARRGISSPTLETLNALAHALQMQPWELLADDEATREDYIRRALQGPSSDPPKVVAHSRRKKPGAGANH